MAASATPPPKTNPAATTPVSKPVVPRRREAKERTLNERMVLP
jgi:hypothetical protein